MWPVTIAAIAALLLGELSAAVALLACAMVSAGLLRTTSTRSRRATRECLKRLGHDDEVEGPAPTHSPIERTSHRLAACLAWSAAASAALTFAITRNIETALSVIIVAGVGALVLGTPLAMRGTIGRAARAGVFIRDATCVEQLSLVDTVVLDQTIAVSGKLRVHAVYPATGISVNELLAIAAMAESRSEHAIGRAIVEYASRQGVPIREPDRFTASPGQGVSARCNGQQILVGTGKFVTAGRFLETREEEHARTVYVTRGGQYLGAIAVSDVLRQEVLQAVAGLKRLGIKTHLLSSATGPGADRIARELGVDAYDTGVLPELKTARITELARQRRIAYVDGLLDDAARASPGVGLRIVSAGDVSRSNGDILLADDELGGLVGAVRLARRARRIIWTSVAGTLSIDVVGIAVVAAGLLTPLEAALVNVSSVLLLTLNAARLMASRREDHDSIGS
jgi:P-type E1-E2 ATPase